jgi:thymidylate synthase
MNNTNKITTCTARASYKAIVALDEKNGIGKNSNIPWNVVEDRKHFYKITTYNQNQNQKQKQKLNMVVMGRKTWDSIPDNKRPLKNRHNVVISRKYSKCPQNIGEMSWGTSDPTVIDDLAYIYDVGTIFIIGGEQIYKEFAKRIDTSYVTRIPGDFLCDTFYPNELLKPIEMSTESMKPEKSCTFEIWNYKVNHEMNHTHHDLIYLNLLKYVLANGEKRKDRTKTGTISVFSPNPLRFNVSECVPLLTTKKMAWKGIIKELLWFIRGDTDAKILRKQGVHIWDGNSSREFLDKRNLSYQEGIIGPVYGWQFRRFGAEYDECYADASNITAEISRKLGGIDQLANVEYLLKTDPYSRRIYMNLWNASDLDKMALTPCHCGIQFYVSQEQEQEQLQLSCHVYIRSNDLFLGNPYNIFSYTVLLYIMAKRCNMKPKELIISFGDAHIYNNHIDQVNEQLNREPYPSPQLILSDAVATKDFTELDITDFELVGYECHSPITAIMAI